ncbi:hypothetical protein VNO78_20190 [Psophocarpus tetragonolobus]|uniref:Uncharacterized protein n=1 Tax=Psophocarpus tetragonolobus TaxID=3891 RepID=A0AAN9SAG8_PSOTE
MQCGWFSISPEHEGHLPDIRRRGEGTNCSVTALGTQIISATWDPTWYMSHVSNSCLFAINTNPSHTLHLIQNAKKQNSHH